MKFSHRLFGALIAALLLMPQFAMAQTAQSVQIRYSKADQPGLAITFPYSENIVETAVRNRMDREEVGKRRSSKGFDYYRAEKWGDISANHVDIYTKVDGNRSSSTVNLLVSKGYDNFVSGTIDEVMYKRMQDFLTSLKTDIDLVVLQEAIKAQEEAVKEKEKAVRNALDEESKLAKQKEAVEKAIEAQQKEKANTARLLADEQAKLAEMQKGLK